MPCTRHELYRVGFADHMKSHAMRWAAPHMLPLLLLHVIVMSIPFTLHLCLLPLSFRFLFKLINAYRLINTLACIVIHILLILTRYYTSL